MASVQQLLHSFAEENNQNHFALTNISCGCTMLILRYSHTTLEMIVKSQTFRFGSNFILKIQNLDLAHHETNDNDRTFGFE